MPAGRPYAPSRGLQCGRLVPLGAHRESLFLAYSHYRAQGMETQGSPVCPGLGYYLELVCFTGEDSCHLYACEVREWTEGGFGGAVRLAYERNQ